MRPAFGLVCQRWMVSSYWIARIAAGPRRLGDLAQQLGGRHLPRDLARGHGAGLPGLAVGDAAEEVVGEPHRVVGVLELDGAPGVAVQAQVVAHLAERVGLLLLVRLGAHELEDVGVVRVEDHHLRGPPGAAAGLDRPGAGVGPAHEADGTRRLAAVGQGLAVAAQARQVHAGARPAAEDLRLRGDPALDGRHGVVDRQDEARRGLVDARLALPDRRLVDVQDPVGIGLARRDVNAAVEPDRGVERRLLRHEDVPQLLGEGLRLLVVGEVAPRGAVVADGVDHPVERPGAGCARGAGRPCCSGSTSRRRCAPPCPTSPAGTRSRPGGRPRARAGRRGRARR